MRKKLELCILMLVFMLSGCGTQVEDTNEAALAMATLPEASDEDEYDAPYPEAEVMSPGTDTEPNLTREEDTPLSGIDEAAWESYRTARDKMSGLSAREENSMVYTTQENELGYVEQSIQVNVKFTGLGTEQAELSAVGTVKVNDQVIPLEIYYTDGYVYTSGASGRVKGTSTFEETAATVDILAGLSNELTREYITAIRQFSYVDGTTIIEMAFKGMIGGMDTMGNGEIIINEEGYIVSQRFDLQAEALVDGISTIVRQSAECITLNYGDAVTQIEFPELNTYTEAYVNMPDAN